MVGKNQCYLVSLLKRDWQGKRLRIYFKNLQNFAYNAAELCKKGNIKSLSYDLFKTGFKYSNTRILRDQAIEIHNYDKQYYPFYRLKNLTLLVCTGKSRFNKNPLKYF